MGKLLGWHENVATIRLKGKKNVWLITPCNRSSLNLPNTSCHAQRTWNIAPLYVQWITSNGMHRPRYHFGQLDCQGGGPGSPRCGDMTTRQQSGHENVPLTIHPSCCFPSLPDRTRSSLSAAQRGPVCQPGF
jgi:hypothetical protein